MQERRPNILVIIVDQLRFPQWFVAAPGRGVGLPPNLQRLREGRFVRRHYTAANDCTPSRSAMLTGLYTHQTGCMITGGSTLDPGLSDVGRDAARARLPQWWYGKWHLTHHDSRWTPAGRAAARGLRLLRRHLPLARRRPRAGLARRPEHRAQFEHWFAHEGGGEPWCTTVSFVNPHDIAWWYRWTDRVPAEAQAPSASRMPPNFETPELLIARNKPRPAAHAPGHLGRLVRAGALQRSRSAGKLAGIPRPLHEAPARCGSSHRPRAAGAHSRPEVAANTVIVFTSDHGEYGASHGLRGKGASAYEEGIRVPLLVKDPRGVLTARPNACARSSPRASTWRRCCSRSPAARTSGGASPTTPTSRAGPTSPGSSPTRPRRAVPTSCTRPTRS